MRTAMRAPAAGWRLMDKANVGGVFAATRGHRFHPRTRKPAVTHSHPEHDTVKVRREALRSRRDVRTMRNARALTITQQLAVAHKSMEAPPPADSLFWVLWNDNRDIAKAALHTPFIQGIARGTLDPVTYGRYNVSDAYYCFHGADDYAIAAKKAKDVVLKAFLHAKHASYRSYNETFPHTWHIRDSRGIEPGDICRDYSKFEREVVQRERPIYALVAMLPCEHLWPWLGTSIGPSDPSNLYKCWIDENSDFGGAYKVGNVIAGFEERHPGEIDIEKACDIYRTAMTYEWQNFLQA